VKVRRQKKNAKAAAAPSRNLIRGRFARGRLPEVEAFTASLPFDRRLFRHDIRGSIAHAQMLAKAGLLRANELRLIVGGLERIENEIAAGHFKFDLADEDIHLAIERRLIALIGDPGRKLHTGRSRNDQVALDLRLYLRDEIAAVIALYFNVFVLVVQLFRRVPALSAMAPTQSEPPFQIAQLAVLLLFAAIGIRAATVKPQRGLVP